ncbi:NADH-quinone oxidoreductase subunit NuoH [Desulfoscipio sp. XC116]|uniref:NADH-quinone oxidoreductase subunit NuoH n=1 Tax=Desulfoscipio sp. XC116 TaxID=3144975 RepID=UPI00325AB524
MGENIFTNIAGWLRSVLDAAGAPLLLNDITLMIVKLVAILLFILLNSLWLVYMERRVAGIIQSRLGPNRVGPQGLLQPFADMLKALSKEIFLPKDIDRVVYLLMPMLIFVPPFLIYAVLPFGRDMVAINMNIGVFYLLAVASLTTIILWGAGWSSDNKYSLIGGMRAVAQMVSYELPLALSLLGVIMITGTLNMNEIVNAQKNVWFMFTQPIAFLVFFIAGIAETNRTPFCLVEGESEIIAGPFTEYSGLAWNLFSLSEYVSLMVISAMCTVMFLGGWLAPFGLDFIPSWLWFFLKMYVMIFIFMWVRWTYPRIRIDHLLGFGWKVLVPLTLANIFVTGAGMYIYRAIGW